MRWLTSVITFIAAVGSGAANADGGACVVKRVGDRVHQQTQRVQVLVSGQDKEAECFWIVRPF